MDTLGKRLHVNFLGYKNWFMSIRISQLRCHSISVVQDRYDTSVVATYIYTTTKKENLNTHETTLPYDIIFDK